MLFAVTALLSGLVAQPALAQTGNGGSPAPIVNPDGNIVFTGNGWGHGVGLSQWGAYSRAIAGHSAEEILAFYYEGTTLVDNYGRPPGAPAPTPTPTPTPVPVPPVVGGLVSLQDEVSVHLATANTTTLTPQGLNRITIDDQDIPHNGQAQTRAPAGTPITITRNTNNWQITINGLNICANGCPGQTAQLHFGTGTSVKISNTGRSYSHGRINLIATDNSPNNFLITLDSVTAQNHLNDNHQLKDYNPVVGGLVSLQDEVSVHLATANNTILTPQGLNRITIDDQDIPHNGQAQTRAPAGTPITIAHDKDNWHVKVNGISICANGCPGQTAQLHFGTGTSVKISNTGRSYSHGRINLIATDNSPNNFLITLDSVTAQNHLNDNHQIGLATEPIFDSAPAPVHSPTFTEDSINIHLATATFTVVTPEGANWITIDGRDIPYNGQPQAQAPANAPITFTYNNNHWHVKVNGISICGNGCPGRTAQVVSAAGTSVKVSSSGRAYAHGRVNLIPTDNSPEEFFVTLDSISMEDYLKGIAETPTEWPLIVHEAQAIAARTYAFATVERRRASPNWSNPFDLYASVWDQYYAGDFREKDPTAGPWLQAVANTTGQILTYQGEPVETFYSSSNGGHTERNDYVFFSSIPYLSAKPDPFDTIDSPHAIWTRTYPISVLNRWLGDHPDTSVGQLISMEVVDGVGASGRLDKAQLRIVGTERTITITGSRLQSRINTAAREDGVDQLLSTKFSFSLPQATPPPIPQSEPPVNEPAATPEPTPEPEPELDPQFYTGNINSPTFCTNLSLGGPITYPFDSNQDGIADICSLPRTRRAAVAHQQALEQLATQYPAVFNTNLAITCTLVPETLGEPAAEATDECSPHRTPNPPVNPAPPQTNSPAPISPTFYTGIINNPAFCANLSLGGPITYPFDSNQDGIADICSLPRTRRAAVAHQQALEQLATQYPAVFNTNLAITCTLVPETLGEPAAEATDECSPHRTPNPQS